MSIILFFIILLLLVVAHEFGHFIVAKKAGIRVDEFAFGFPPKLFGIKKGETTYSFNALPLGGYVKIYGENPNDVHGPDTKRSFIAQPRIVQAAVIVAGIVFNLLLAWFLIAATLMIGIPSPVEGGEGGYAVTSPRLMVTGVHEDAPAFRAGLLSGDILLRISDGRDTIEASAPEVVSQFIAPREGKPLTVTYEHKGETKELTLLPESGISPSGAAIGIYMDMVGTLRLPIHQAIWEGLIKTYQYTEMTVVGIYGFLGNTLLGRGDFTQVTGPVGIVHAVGEAAGIGIANVLLFTALISINLAVINVIPFPALDGGRLLFVAIEAIIRQPIKPAIANAFNIAGFALLMLLMLAVTYHDVAKLMH